MPLLAKAGSFTSKGSTGSQSITGVGFQPKVVLLFGVNNTSDGTIQNNSVAGLMGCMTDAGEVGCTSWFTDSGVGTSQAKKYTTMTYPLLTVTTAVFERASYTSMDSDGFTINYGVSAGNAAIIYHYLALGGADLTNYKLTNWTSRTSAQGTGTINVTGVGFKPDCLINWGVCAASLDSVLVNPIPVFGAAAGIDQHSSTCWMIDAAGTSATGRTQTASYLGLTYFNDAIFDFTALSSFNSDGYDITQVAVGGSGGFNFLGLSLKGPQFSLGSIAPKTTADGTAPLLQTINLNFSPKALLNFHAARSAYDSHSADAILSIGAASGASSRWATHFNDQDNLDVTSTYRWSETDEFHIEGSTTTKLRTADIDAFGNKKFSLQYDIIDGTARPFSYLAIGNSVVPPPFRRRTRFFKQNF